MYLNNRTSGASCKNTVDVIANSVSLYDPNGDGHYTDINNIFLHQDQVIKAELNNNGKFEYPISSVNDENVSGLQSMLDYIRTHQKNRNFIFEDNSLTLIKKKVNASKKSFLYEDNQVVNKINKTINKVSKTYLYEDSNNYTFKKNIKQIHKHFITEDNSQLIKTVKLTNNNNYKYYNLLTLQDNHNMIKQTSVNHITQKIIPNYINQEYNFYNQQSGYSKSYLDNYFNGLENIINILSNRILALENKINPSVPGSAY